MLNDLYTFLQNISLRNRIKEIEQYINEQYSTYGSPYVAICFTCNSIYPCILIRHTPFSDRPNEVLGLIVFVDKDHPLDETMEKLFKITTTIRSYGEKIAFYIPFKYSMNIIRRVCEKIEKAKIEVYSLKIEEAEIFIE